MKSVLRRAAGCAESVSSFVDFFTPVKGWSDYRYAVSSEGKPPHLLNRIFWVAWFHIVGIAVKPGSFGGLVDCGDGYGQPRELYGNTMNTLS